MTGGEFLRKLKVLGTACGVKVKFVAGHGKGSHGRVYFGPAFTSLKDRKKEIGKGLLQEMCKNLGIKANDL